MGEKEEEKKKKRFLVLIQLAVISHHQGEGEKQWTAFSAIASQTPTTATITQVRMKTQRSNIIINRKEKDV